MQKKTLIEAMILSKSGGNDNLADNVNIILYNLFTDICLLKLNIHLI